MTMSEQPVTFDVMVNYGQVTVHLPSIERPGHEWGDAELEQGFAWSPGIVSLGVPEHCEDCRVEVLVAPAATLSPDAISAVSVPFTIPASPILVGSVFHFDEVAIAPGDYTLVTEILPVTGDADTDSEYEPSHLLRLHFSPGGDGAPAILKAGGAVRSERVLAERSALA